MSPPTESKKPGSACGTTVDTVDGLVRVLRRHPLLSAEEREELGHSLAREFTDPQTLARELCRRGWLTTFQANRVFRGRAEELFLDRYVLLEPLGAGGTGQVFKARHLHLGRLSAVKVIRPEFLSDAQVVGRFYREMRAASRLAHPHVVQAHDGGPLGGTHVLVSEFVDGPDLSGLVGKSGPLPAETVCRFVRQAALGLQHIHEQGLVHRDVKPSNLLLAPDGAEGIVKVLDLGLARLLTFQNAPAVNLSGSCGGTMMGTADYMAPEQATDFSGADARADIYSLGCVFVYLLTGRPLFEGRLAERIMKHQQAPPPSAAQLSASLPREADEVIGRMLAKRPQDRYQSAAEMAKAMVELQTVLAKPKRRWSGRCLAWLTGGN